MLPQPPPCVLVTRMRPASHLPSPHHLPSAAPQTRRSFDGSVDLASTLGDFWLDIGTGASSTAAGGPAGSNAAGGYEALRSARARHPAATVVRASWAPGSGGSHTKGGSAAGVGAEATGSGKPGAVAQRDRLLLDFFLPPSMRKVRVGMSAQSILRALAHARHPGPLPFASRSLRAPLACELPLHHMAPHTSMMAMPFAGHRSGWQGIF